MMFEDRDAYTVAELEARKEIGALDPPLAAAERGVEFDQAEHRFRVAVLGENVSVGFPGGEVTGDGGRRLSGAVAVIALHYLTHRGEPLHSRGWLAYRDMPGGRDFSRTFESMAEARLAGHFGDEPQEFQRSALAMGGAGGDVGKFSFVINALPRLPLMLVLWPACEELGGGARILFRPSAPYYLHTEDLAALGVVTAERLMGLSEGPGDVEESTRKDDNR